MGFLYTGSLAQTCKSVVPTFVCPSDPNGIKTVTYASDQQGFHGNIAGNAGSTTFNTTGCDGGKNLNGVFYAQRPVGFAGITDGTAHTLLFSEVRVVRDQTGHDTRGRYWNNAFQGSIIFSTLRPPNPAARDRLQWCQDTPTVPCEFGYDNIVQYARSAHAGGVNVALADGSGRFVRNGVDPAVWLNLGTRAGGETPGDY